MADKSMPLNMLTAGELAEKLKKFGCPLNAKELEDLALADKMPYWLWVIPKGGTSASSVPLFQLTATKEWMVQNDWLSFKEGDPPATPKGEAPLRQRVMELEETVRALLAKGSDDGK